MSDVDHSAAEGTAVAGGSGAAIGGGMWAAISSPDKLTSIVGILVASAGLVTALGGLIVPLVRIWSQAQQAERDRRERNHDLANRLQAATLRTTELQGVIETQEVAINANRQLIETVLALLPPDVRDQVRVPGKVDSGIFEMRPGQ